MKRMRAVLVLVLVVAVSLSLPGATSLAQEVLTNDSLVALKKAGLSDAIIISKIRSSQTNVGVCATICILALSAVSVVWAIEVWTLAV